MLQQCPDHRIGIFRDAAAVSARPTVARYCTGFAFRNAAIFSILFSSGILSAPAPLPVCPVETTLTLISDKWKVLILRDLMSGTKRFGELKRSIGHVTQKVLTVQLRQMEASGLLTRKVYAEVPPRVEYTLTDLGYSLKPILDAMWTWGEGYQKMMSTQPPEA